MTENVQERPDDNGIQQFLDYAKAVTAVTSTFALFSPVAAGYNKDTEKFLQHKIVEALVTITQAKTANTTVAAWKTLVNFANVGYWAALEAENHSTTQL